MSKDDSEGSHESSRDPQEDDAPNERKACAFLNQGSQELPDSIGQRHVSGSEGEERNEHVHELCRTLVEACAHKETSEPDHEEDERDHRHDYVERNGTSPKEEVAPGDPFSEGAEESDPLAPEA